MSSNDTSRASGAPSRHSPRTGRDVNDSVQAVDDQTESASSLRSESSYSAAALSKGRSTARRDGEDAPFEVRIEFVRLDGSEGRALRRRQAQIMRKVLRWLADHPDRQ